MLIFVFISQYIYNIKQHNPRPIYNHFNCFLNLGFVLLNEESQGVVCVSLYLRIEMYPLLFSHFTTKGTGDLRSCYFPHSHCTNW